MGISDENGQQIVLSSKRLLAREISFVYVPTQDNIVGFFPKLINRKLQNMNAMLDELNSTVHGYLS